MKHFNRTDDKLGRKRVTLPDIRETGIGGAR